MTEPFRLTEGEAEDSFELPPPAPSWIERVRQADAEAEHQWDKTKWVVDEIDKGDEIVVVAQALRTIAAELRAQRIAQRPGVDRS
jgi:hypothetical protein